MNDRCQVAAVQMVSGDSVDANLAEAQRLIEEAATGGARLVVLPECFAFMGQRLEDQLDLREDDGAGPLQAFLARMACAHGVWIVGGTIPLAADAPDRVRAACLVFDDGGRRVARYDKIHLFDVLLPQVGERYQESAVMEPGSTPVVIDSPGGRLGLGVCYDLRFPELFRRLLDDGLEVLALPAAFTAVTGAIHWESLVRARAIENQVYVVAAAQGGVHPNGRETHGDSMVIDPWGTILDRLPKGPGLCRGTLDRDYQAAVRCNFPALDHRRLKSG
jgi:deaminated glutathione amidase